MRSAERAQRRRTGHRSWTNSSDDSPSIPGLLAARAGEDNLWRRSSPPHYLGAEEALLQALTPGTRRSDCLAPDQASRPALISPSNLSTSSPACWAWPFLSDRRAVSIRKPVEP